MKNLATGQIRMDHTHAMAAFHRYRPDLDPKRKYGLAKQICLALEIHGHLEEEIFYPAMRAAGIGTELIDSSSLPEHAEQHRLIARLRGLDPDDSQFEPTLLELMRLTLHHIADEETLLLPEAERRLSHHRLMEIGKEMTRRRMQLSTELGADIADSFIKASSSGTKLLTSGAILAGAFLVGRAIARSMDHEESWEAAPDYPESGYPEVTRPPQPPGQGAPYSGQTH